MTGPQRRPVAYLRRSQAPPEGQTDQSWPVQEAAVKKLASQFDDADGLLLLFDWSRSGRQGGAGRRPGYQRLLAMLEDGEVTAVYSYSLSRLSRGVRDLYDLFDLAAAKDVPIRLVKEGSMDPTTAVGKVQLGVMAVLAQFELDLAADRAKDAVALRRREGMSLGAPPFGHAIEDGKFVPADHEQNVIERMIEFYRETGSFQETARRLTVAGAPTRRGKPFWGSTAVRQIIRREAPGLVPATVARGRAGLGGFRLSGLIRCHCGTVMTGRRFRAKYVSYVCKAGVIDPNHRRPVSISEKKLMPHVRRAVGRLRFDPERADKLKAREQRAQERLKRLTDAMVDGVITREEYVERRPGLMAEIDQARRAVTQAFMEARSVDDDPAEVNRYLRGVFEAFDLNDSYDRVTPVFRTPELVEEATFLDKVQETLPGQTWTEAMRRRGEA